MGSQILLLIFKLLGVPDFDDHKTADAAVKEFQRDGGITQDGWIDSSVFDASKIESCTEAIEFVFYLSVETTPFTQVSSRTVQKSLR